MFIVLMPALAVLLSWMVWHLLGRRRISAVPRLLAAAAAGCLAAMVLYWAGIYGSILMFQMKDSATW